MRETTLCYLEKEGCYLMLLRNKKKADPNQGKWIGVGGKLETGESPEQCLVREVMEETGITLMEFTKRGVIFFYSDAWEDEIMHLYTAQVDEEVRIDCPEGTLRWIPLSEILHLNLWEGDRIFLEKLIRGETDLQISLYYRGETLAEAVIYTEDDDTPTCIKWEKRPSDRNTAEPAQ